MDQYILIIVVEWHLASFVLVCMKAPVRINDSSLMSPIINVFLVAAAYQPMIFNVYYHIGSLGLLAIQLFVLISGS